MNLQDEVLTMKRAVLPLVALLAGIVPAKSQTVPGQPVAGVSNTVQRATKLTLTQPWKDSTIPLLIPASSHAPGRIENLKAKRATYEITPEPGQRQDPSLLGHSSVGRSSWEDTPLHVIAAEDPYAGKTFIIQDFSRAVYSGPPVYVSRTSGMTGMAVEPDGPLVWIESDFEMAGSTGKLEAAIRRFETECDARKLLEKRAKMRTSVWVKDARGKVYETYVANPTRINLAAAAPYLFFHSLMPGDNIMVLPQIEGLGIIEDILRLDVRNPVRQKVASFWIDLEARKVIRCVADGKELDLPIDRSRLWFPPEKESKPANK